MNLYKANYKDGAIYILEFLIWNVKKNKQYKTNIPKGKYVHFQGQKAPSALIKASMGISLVSIKNKSQANRIILYQLIRIKHGR